MHREDLSTPAKHELCVDFLVRTPREHVVYFGGSPSIVSVRGAVAGVPKLQELHLIGRMLDQIPTADFGRTTCKRDKFPITATSTSGRYPFIRGRLELLSHP